MAGLIKSNVQLGDSATATQNFTLSVPAVPDGTVKLARGNAGATTQDLITVSATNIVTGGSGAVLVGNGPVFFTTFTGTTVPAITVTELGLNSKTFDTGNFVNTTTGRFTPTVAGYYQLNATSNQGAASISGMVIYIRKNGASSGIEFALSTSTSGPYQGLSVSGLLYLNGSTDYASVAVYNASGTGTAVGTFSGALVRAA